MIQLNDINSCSDSQGSFQREGIICNEYFSRIKIESLLQNINFQIFSIGNPAVLVCRRSDCLLLIYSNGTFTISEVSSIEKMLQIIDEIRNHLKILYRNN